MRNVPSRIWYGFPILILALMTPLLVSCSIVPQGDDMLNQLAIPSSQELLPVAYEAARGWREDAHLDFVFLFVRPEPDATFGFSSPSDPDVGLNVHIQDPLGDQDTRPVEVSMPARSGPVPSVDAYVQGGIDSNRAFNIALEAGGRSFLDTHPEAWGEAWEWNVNLQYVRAPAGELPAWRVYFTDLESEGFEVLIDPHTGEVLATVEGP